MAIVGYTGQQWIYGVLFWGGLIAAIVLYTNRTKAKNEAARQSLNAAFGAAGATSYQDFGTYVTGLPNSPVSGSMSCGLAGHQFVLLYNGSGQQAGAIPAASITSVRVMDESTVQEHVQTMQRLTATRLALFGAFALAAPKRKTTTSTTVNPKFVLLAEWSGDGGIQEATAFRFLLPSAANGAADYLRRGRLQVSESDRPAA